jgi:hypothetical protein
MKKSIICPNKNDPAWKLLVAELADEALAYISFFRNGDVIPDVATARAKLGIKQTAPVPSPKRPLSKSKKPKATAPKAATHFRRAVVPKINAEKFTTHFGRTRHTSNVLIEA